MPVCVRYKYMQATHLLSRAVRPQPHTAVLLVHTSHQAALSLKAMSHSYITLSVTARAARQQHAVCSCRSMHHAQSNNNGTTGDNLRQLNPLLWSSRVTTQGCTPCLDTCKAHEINATEHSTTWHGMCLPGCMPCTAVQLNTDAMTWPLLQERILQRCRKHTEAQGNSPDPGLMSLVMTTRHTPQILPYRLPIWPSVTQQHFFLLAAQQAHAAVAADTRKPASQPATKAHQAGFTAAKASSGSNTHSNPQGVCCTAQWHLLPCARDTLERSLEGAYLTQTTLK